jgi:methionyl-tRNA synthetase
MIEKYCGGAIPAVAQDAELSAALQSVVAQADAAMEELDFQGALVAIMDFCKQVNGYVTIKEPWILVKTPTIKRCSKMFFTAPPSHYVHSQFSCIR